jgi:hypothetical protein
MDAFLDLFAATGDKRFLDDARMFGRAVVKDLIPADDGVANLGEVRRRFGGL